MVFNYGQGQLHHSPLCINVHRAYNEWNPMKPAYFLFECYLFLYFFITVSGHKEVIATPKIYELQAPV